MKLTRRQFGFGILLSALALLFGKFLGGCRGFEEPEVGIGAEARHWTPGDHLAG